MAKTTRKRKDRYWANIESPTVKRICRRLYRRACRQLVREEKFDELYPRKGTEGWITW